MQPLVTESIGEAPSEIEETEPTQLPDSNDVGEAETSMGRQKDLSSKSEGKKKEAWQFNQSKEDLRKLFKDRFNKPEDIQVLKKFLLDVQADLETTRENAKSRKRKKKRWGKKAHEGESGGESKLGSKGLAVITDTEEVLKKISDIGVKPATTSGSKVASESYNLLHEVLKGIGNLHWAAVGISMVAFFLDRVKEVGDNSGKCLDLLEIMCSLGLDMVNAFPHFPQNEDLLWKISTEITNGVSLCCSYHKSGRVSRFVFSTVNKGDFESLSKNLKKLSGEFVRAMQLATLEGQREIQTQIEEIRRNVVSSAHEPECTTKTGYAAFGNFRHLPPGILGIDIPLKVITEKLRNLGDRGTLGLVGMGGVGKTTLAKAVFNELLPDFEYSCFVADVKLKEGNRDVIMKEALTEMHYKGKKVKKEFELSELAGKPLLLVFYDISSGIRDGEEEVLSRLRSVTASQSRFIVTSREKDLVDNLGEAYLVPFLNEEEALKLFKSHAFPGNESPPQALHSHMETIVTKCEGLPLTLTVLGKYLQRKKDEKCWRETMEALMKAEDVKNLTDRLWAKLRPSYDGLGSQEQQIFLDAATFFNVKYAGEHWFEPIWRLRDAKVASSVYGKSVTLWWQMLVDFCLVYDVKDDEPIRVHEQLQSLGVKIAEETSKDRNCRVWDAELGLQMLKSPDRMIGKTFHAFRAGHLRPEWATDGEDVHIPSTALQNLEQLRFFDAGDRIVIDGAEEQGSVLSELVLLKCVGQNLFNPTFQKRLVILHISKLENLPDTIGQLPCLKELTITHSPHLRFLPDSFGGLSSLSYLQFSGCGNLRTLPDSFGGLSSLSYLKFFRCKNLRTLPDSFGGLSSLSHLQFFDCENLRTLPDSFGGLSSLSHLEFLLCENLLTLPDSFGVLSSLSHLEFYRCENLCTLPHFFGGLSCLKHLMLDAENMRNSVGDLENLSYLENLCYLEIWLTFATSIQDIQDRVKHLRSLQTLKLFSGSVRDTRNSLLPRWLKDTNAPASSEKYSQIEFQVQDGYFSVINSRPFR